MLSIYLSLQHIYIYIYIYIIKLFLANLVSSASIRSSKGPGMVSSSLAVQTWIHWIRDPRIHGTHRDTSGRAGLPTKSTLDLHQLDISWNQLESVGISWITWVMSWHVMTSWKNFSQPMITNHQRISKNGMGYDGMHWCLLVQSCRVVAWSLNEIRIWEVGRSNGTSCTGRIMLWEVLNVHPGLTWSA